MLIHIDGIHHIQIDTPTEKIITAVSFIGQFAGTLFQYSRTEFILIHSGERSGMCTRTNAVHLIIGLSVRPTIQFIDSLSINQHDIRQTE